MQIHSQPTSLDATTVHAPATLAAQKAAEVRRRLAKTGLKLNEEFDPIESFMVGEELDGAPRRQQSRDRRSGVKTLHTGEEEPTGKIPLFVPEPLEQIERMGASRAAAESRLAPCLGPAPPPRHSPRSIIAAMVQDALGHHRAGRLKEAERIYRQVLAIDTDADSLHLLGMIAYQRGHYSLAVAKIEEAIAVRGEVSSYHCNLGAALQAEGRLRDASSAYRRALALKPNCAIAHVNLALIFQAEHNLDEALAHCRLAGALKPDSAEIQMNLGSILDELGKPDEALRYYESALALKPQLAEVHYNMGNVFCSQARLDEAMTCYERALSIWPSYARAHHNLGHALRGLGMLDEALVRYRKASKLLPNDPDIGFSEATAQLLHGDFGQAWPGYEWRWKIESRIKPKRVYSQPLWTGERLRSGRLLIWGEQGIGDEIMFAGLMPDLIATGNPCILDCDPRLQPLLARSFPGLEVITSAAPHHDITGLDVSAHLPAGSLPGIFRASDATFSVPTSPYLVADSAQRDQFRASYSDGRRRVGLAWDTSNPKTGPKRRIDLSLFAALFAESEFRWISLQYGSHAELEVQAEEAHAPLSIDRTVDQLVDMDRFAAQVASMDLVITIDNATAHLAGALGIPVWVLLPFAPIGAGNWVAATVPGTRRCVCSASPGPTTGVPSCKRSASRSC
jgi:tetratricopeptide (TPR) repeat protein